MWIIITIQKRFELAKEKASIQSTIENTFKYLVTVNLKGELKTVSLHG